MLRLLRFSILVVMTLIVISLIIAVTRPETGPAEKVVLGVAIVGLIVAARPVQRLGSRAACGTPRVQGYLLSSTTSQSPEKAIDRAAMSSGL